MINYSLKIIYSVLVFLSFQMPLYSQILHENLGLIDKQIMSIGIWDNVLAVGTLKQGVYWQTVSTATDTGWQFLGLDSAEVYSVYPHKSGPLGWAIGAGLNPDFNYPHYIYCSFLGGPFESRDTGISDSLSVIIYELDGFPDPTVCGETFAATGGAVYRRNFADSIWVPVYTATVEGYIVTIKVHEEFPGVVLAGGAEGFAGQVILKSLDFGDSWELLSPPGMVLSLDFSGDSAQTIFAVTLQGLYRSMDSGQSWNSIYQNSTYPPERVIYDQTSGTLFLSGSFDPGTAVAPLLFSTDLGNSWKNIPIIFRNSITDLDFDISGFLYVSTFDSGLYRLDPAILGISPGNELINIRNFQLEQNFPNPFNSYTTIEYYLPSTCELRVTIYNLLGQTVQTLFQGQHMAGLHKLHWDGRDDTGREISSGVYIYQVASEHYLQSKKMLLIR